MTDPYMSRGDRREVRRGAFYVLRWALAIIVVATLIGWGLWALGVGTSDVRGRGEAIKTKNSSTNRISAQERFEDMAADITAAKQRITTMQTNMKANPKDYTAQVQATGAVTYCQQAVAQYNAEARKYTAAQFRASDLPASFDAATDCTGAATA